MVRNEPVAYIYVHIIFYLLKRTRGHIEPSFVGCYVKVMFKIHIKFKPSFQILLKKMKFCLLFKARGS